MVTKSMDNTDRYYSEKILQQTGEKRCLVKYTRDKENRRNGTTHNQGEQLPKRM